MYDSMQSCTSQSVYRDEIYLFSPVHDPCVDESEGGALRSGRALTNRAMEECLTFLRQGSDEFKFAGLLMVPKVLPTLQLEDQDSFLRKVPSALGLSFLRRLLSSAEQEDSAEHQKVALDVLCSCQMNSSFIGELEDSLLSLFRTTTDPCILDDVAALLFTQRTKLARATLYRLQNPCVCDTTLIAILDATISDELPMDTTVFHAMTLAFHKGSRETKQAILLHLCRFIEEEEPVLDAAWVQDLCRGIEQILRSQPTSSMLAITLQVCSTLFVIYGGAWTAFEQSESLLKALTATVATEVRISLDRFLLQSHTRNKEVPTEPSLVVLFASLDTFNHIISILGKCEVDDGVCDATCWHFLGFDLMLRLRDSIGETVEAVSSFLLEIDQDRYIAAKDTLMDVIGHSVKTLCTWYDLEGSTEGDPYGSLAALAYTATLQFEPCSKSQTILELVSHI